MLKRTRDSFRYALAGIRLAWTEELNFRIEVICAVLVLAAGWAANLSPIEFAIVVLASAFVLATEVVNTALEELCDKFQPSHDPHISRIKDLAAAAVLLASFGACIIGIIIFIPHL